ncbi:MULTISPECIES: FMN-dependent NADH-azoreductase [Chryseobacterium]|uniref:FMN dependent NADH:quinone oxidoreductase n=1 Tax=Chryseobacterium camelliae TaxID=1265445 RepID=A0ABU0TNT8_9FLAO|nr:MULTISPECIES: NAD(P)H-dependent oxidoreductase [Chryseobacterium]MDT3407438.1 FMN-dependent NADH-azoreductase [Pseudacidovorax intermedius]MDQ1098711.1 FMN-dependent NADH-azoreductase [Chryseobacterium camelliae]MDQ1102638.1 FMN-dependent NADH-azoreductase [Chryseobacterium sp. SORGH_AS_1048]MDR6086067.1 FMN-dependent NADH-azoreductase [Chryseobacterium sp. SORGH_AS_0909]MDR6130435.1 FMN-dependent NADH-azoreductase [Chryseobacterium sp. SORGH_AS_1175]
MKNILHISSSSRTHNSSSRILGNAIEEKLQNVYPEHKITTLDLLKNPFPHLGEEQVEAWFIPAESRTNEQNEAVKRSDDAIAQLQASDIIVISVPIYNFGIPSVLKAYIDHIARGGITFRYSENGFEGLVKNKKAYIAVASGSVFSEGDYQPYDFVVPYLKSVLGFIGITDISIVRAEGLSLPDLQDTALEKGIQSIVIG